MTSIKTCSARNDHVTIRAITILPSPFHTWEPVFYLQLHSEWPSIVQSENIFAKGLRYGGQSNEEKEAKERKKITFDERPTGLSVSPSASRPWNQLTSRGRSSYRIVGNAGEEGGLRNASKYHDIGTPIVGHPATSSGFLFVLANS